jgi:hypothetical protein
MGPSRGIKAPLGSWSSMSRDIFAKILDVFLGRRPFTPFTVELLSGAKLEVNHPEALMLYERHFVYRSTTHVRSVMEYAVVQRFYESTGS